MARDAREGDGLQRSALCDKSINAQLLNAGGVIVTVTEKKRKRLGKCSRGQGRGRRRGEWRLERLETGDDGWWHVPASQVTYWCDPDFNDCRSTTMQQPWPLLAHQSQAALLAADTGGGLPGCQPVPGGIIVGRFRLACLAA